MFFGFLGSQFLEALISHQIENYNDINIVKSSPEGLYTYYYSPFEIGILKTFINVSRIIPPVFVAFMTLLGFNYFFNHKIKNPLESIMEDDGTYSINNKDEFSQGIVTLKSLSNQYKEALLEQACRQNELSMSIATLVHGIKGPLTVLKGNSQMLEQLSSSNQDLYEALVDGLQMNVDRIEIYVEKLIHNQDVQEDRLKKEEIYVEDFENYVMSCFKKCSPRLLIEFERSESNGKLNIDHYKLQECLEAIIENGIRYTKERLLISFKKIKGSYVIIIRDDGQGFSKEALNQGFNRFYSENPGPTNLGIGLYNAKSIVSSHDGIIQLSNYENGGEVKIILPIL